METQIVELREVNQRLRNSEQIREERDRKSSERLSQLEARFDELIAAQDKERKLDRAVEIETDLNKKFEKHDKLLEATRQKIKKRSELERTVKEQLQK